MHSLTQLPMVRVIAQVMFTDETHALFSHQNRYHRADWTQPKTEALPPLGQLAEVFDNDDGRHAILMTMADILSRLRRGVSTGSNRSSL